MKTQIGEQNMELCDISEVSRITTRERLSKRTFEFDFHEGLTDEYFRIQTATREIEHGRILEAEISGECPELISLELSLNLPMNSDTRVFMNGWQSWTDSREFALGERIAPLRPSANFLLSAYGDYRMNPHKKELLHGYSCMYLRLGPDDFLFLGSLDENNAFTRFIVEGEKGQVIIEKDLEGARPTSRSPLMKLAVLRGSEEWVWDTYFTLLKIKPPELGPTTGFTSWYNYYTDISEEVLEENLAAYKAIDAPLDVYQIDDGFQPRVGDWLETNQQFPRGMRPIREKIHEAGYVAGLWLAPFICEKKSRVALEHPDWLLRDAKGKAIVAGFNPLWSNWYYALDLELEPVRDYLRAVFRKVLDEWGFDLVKLDFLYVAALLPRNGKTRGRLMHEAMAFLRELVGQKKIIGCGVPLASAFGLVDYCRIGADVDLQWENKPLRFLRYRERVSTFNALLSTIGRRGMGGRAFLNDPDVFILRDIKRSGNPKKITLTEAERYTVFLTNAVFGGLLFSSDDVRDYDEKTLRLFLSFFPFLEREVESVEEFDGLYQVQFRVRENSYLAFLNLSENPGRLRLPDEPGGAGELFYDGRADLFLDESSRGEMLAAHSSLLLLKCPEMDFNPVASTGHMFPLSELEWHYDQEAKVAELALHKDARLDSTVYIRVPTGTNELIVNQKKYKSMLMGDQLLVKVNINKG